LACTPRSDEGASRPASDEGGGQDPQRGKGEGEGEGALPEDPSYAVMQKVCASPCAGSFAQVQVFRDAEGRVARLRYDGDLGSCSHPPRIYFDAAGEQTLAVAERPVEAGSAEAEDLAAKQAEQVEGLREAELLGCFSPEHCKPKRSKGFRSELACRSDSDCASCACAPVNRPEYERRGGSKACNIPGEECIATNPACCAGKCVLAR
jgi:hypothetical protein